jgi:putative membrane protein
MKPFKCILAATAVLLLAGSAATAQEERDRPRGTFPGGAGEQTTEPGRPAGDPTDTREPRRPIDDPSERTQAQSSRGDEKFVKEAAVNAAGELELGRLAAQKAANDEVKQFAQRVVDDQGKAGDQLKAMASQRSIDVPAELDGKHKKAVERLSKLSAEEFDRAYMRQMLDDRKKSVDQFRKAASAARDSEVKMFAAQTLPMLEEQLRTAQQFADANRRDTRGTSGTLPPEGARPEPGPIGRPDPGGGQPDPFGRPGSPGSPGTGQDPGGDRERVR